MPTFCRHNRFIERCPICSKTLPGAAPGGRPARALRTGQRAGGGGEAPRRRLRAEGVRVRREERAPDDGYRSALIAGVRASADAERLAQELAFASARLQVLESDPPGLYGRARSLAEQDIEQATWICFLIAYLSPLEDAEDPFSAIAAVLAEIPELASAEAPSALDGIALGARSSHDPARGTETLQAYRQWVVRTGGAAHTQAVAFAGDPGWSPERRFQRLFERLALPGLGRAGRYELLVTLGRLGIYELRPDSLHLAGAGGVSGGDATTLAGKRVFGIGDPLLLERRAAALAQAAGAPVEALDLALANWAAPQRAGVGVAAELEDADAFARAGEALGL